MSRTDPHARPGEENPPRPTSLAPRPTPSPRLTFVSALHRAITEAAEIHYGRVRPIIRVRRGQLPALPWTTDCSGSITTLAQYAGLPDPNGQHYDGEGFTGTMLDHLPRTTLAHLRPGDLAVFGCKSIPTGHHVTAVLSIEKRTPAGVTVFSHGSERGPFPITVAQEAEWQPDGLAGVVYLALG